MRAQAYRQMGIPPCYTIHNNLECHCCCFELKCTRCIKSTYEVESERIGASTIGERISTDENKTKRLIDNVEVKLR